MNCRSLVAVFLIMLTLGAGELIMRSSPVPSVAVVDAQECARNPYNAPAQCGAPQPPPVQPRQDDGGGSKWQTLREIVGFIGTIFGIFRGFF